MRQTGRSVPKILPLRKTVITVITAFLGYADRRLALPCRTRRAFPAERRPKFISVAVWGARLGVFNLVHQVQPLWELL
jgi:hypothetical protein